MIVVELHTEHRIRKQFHDGAAELDHVHFDAARAEVVDQRLHELVGFVVVVPRERDWLLDHLYIHPSAQGQGIGGWVLEQVLREADARHRAVHVTALKHSDANRLYQRHGFELQAEGEWDLYYLRPAR